MGRYYVLKKNVNVMSSFVLEKECKHYEMSWNGIRCLTCYESSFDEWKWKSLVFGPLAHDMAYVQVCWLRWKVYIGLNVN